MHTQEPSCNLEKHVVRADLLLKIVKAGAQGDRELLRTALEVT